MTPPSPAKTLVEARFSPAAAQPDSSQTGRPSPAKEKTTATVAGAAALGILRDAEVAEGNHREPSMEKRKQLCRRHHPPGPKWA